MIGGSLGTLPNPWILVAGFLVAKEHPGTAKFWIKLICAMAICVLVNVIFDRVFDFPDSNLSFWKLVPWTSLAVVWATLIFLVVRRPWKPARNDTDEEL